MKKVGIIMGSDSDLPIVRKAMDTLAAFGVPYEVHVYSAHRTPDEAGEFAARARADGFGVLIAAAGMAAHLAGAIAARTSLPVIGIPCKSSALDGMDALLSTVRKIHGFGGIDDDVLVTRIQFLNDVGTSLEPRPDGGSVFPGHLLPNHRSTGAGFAAQISQLKSNITQCSAAH